MITAMHTNKEKLRKEHVVAVTTGVIGAIVVSSVVIGGVILSRR